VENQADARPQVLSIPELERMVGIDLLPSLTAAQKTRMLRLPKLRPARRA
jgi:endonuclease G